MALQGTIRDFGLPDIFQLIGLQRKTGILNLTNDKDKESVTVTFEGGMVVMADSSGSLAPTWIIEGSTTGRKTMSNVGIFFSMMGHSSTIRIPSIRMKSALIGLKFSRS